MITEMAKAKINLTLRVPGRRPDGYHELVSLVAFANVGDLVTLDRAASDGIETDGPFAGAIDGENLISKACRLVTQAAPGVAIGRVRLTKNLPVAAGLGGGSADAAALLRALRRAEPGLADVLDPRALAAQLGADVTVCLQQRVALMWGIGERIEPIAPLPACWVVLANPGVPLSTADVFRGLGASALSAPAARPQIPGPFADLDALIAQLRLHGNDLQSTAARLCPAITGVLEALREAPGVRHVAQSGSGPTCFGIFADAATARSAATRLAARHANWWVVAATLG